MDKVPFCSLTPELTLEPRFEEDSNQIRMDDVDQQTRLSQYPLMDYGSNRNSPTDEMLGRQTSGVVDDGRQSDEFDWTGMSEGPLTTRSLIDISIYVPDDNDDSNDNNDAVASSHIYNSPSSSSSAYFSLLDEAAKDGSNSNSWRNSARDNYDVHLPPLRMEPHGTAFVNSQRRFPLQPPVRPLINCSDSSTVTLKNETTDDVSGLPEIYLQPSRRDYDSNVKIEDKSQSGATDDDVVDWPSDHEEGDYLESNIGEEKNFKSLNFKDKPRGEPMGSEDILSSAAAGSSASAYNNLFGGYRSSGYEQDIFAAGAGQLSSDNEKFSGESSDEIDLDLNRSYWLRGNIEGADNNLPLPVLGTTKNCVVDDDDEDDDDVRPPLVGQSEENNDLASLQPILDDLITIEQEVEAGNYNDLLMDIDGTQLDMDDRLHEAAENLSDQDLNRNDSISANHRVLSPSVLSVSSVASSKRLEWDSGADIGYGGPKVTYGLSSLERMAIGCSALKKRMEPEGKSSLVNTGPPLVPPSVQPPSVTASQTDEEPIVPKEERKASEVEIFKNVLVLRNSAFRSASLSDLSPNRKYDRSAKQHSSSTTDIYGNCPIGPVKLISSSSCSAVSTCSSNTVIGIPCISGEGSVASPFDNLSVVTVVKGSGDGDHDGQKLTFQPPSAPPAVQQQVDSSAGKIVVEPEPKSPNVEKVEPKDLVAFTKRFVEQLCADSDEKRKSSLVKKILEDFGVVSDVSTSPSASSLSVPIPPPPPAFEDSVAPQIAVVQEWERSLGSAAYHSPSSLILGSRIGIRNEDAAVRDSDSSMNTVKEMQQQIASSFEYYDPSKSEKNERKSFASSVGNSSVDNVAWVKLLNKKKKQTAESKRFERHRHPTRPHVMETSDDDTCSSNRDFLLKFSSLRKPPTLYSSDSTGSDYQVRGPNPIDTMKRFIRRLEVVDSWHPEGVELIKELIQKQRRSYIRRLQREVDWLERIERVLSVNPSRETAKHGFKDDLESQMNHLVKNNGYEKPKKTVSKVTKKDFSQCYPTPVSTDLEVSCDRSISKVRRCSIGIQTSRSETVASPVQFSNAEVWSSPVQNLGKFIEKERPVVSVPLSIASQTHHKQQRKSVVTSTKERVQLEKQVTRSVAWFLPFGNGQPKLLLGGRRGIADGQRSGSPDTRLTGGKKLAWVSKATSPFALQESFKLLKASAMKRSESRQMKLKMEAELRRRIGLANRQFADNEPEKVFHRVTVPLQISSQHHRPQKRIISHFEMREQTEKIYNVLPEITEKNELKIRQNIYRTNRQMAAMFRKKLQEKVLKGQVSHLTTQKCS